MKATLNRPARAPSIAQFDRVLAAMAELRAAIDGVCSSPNGQRVVEHVHRMHADCAFCTDDENLRANAQETVEHLTGLRWAVNRTISAISTDFQSWEAFIDHFPEYALR
ncbi:MAG: hypothetical protein KF861_00740 [Planctomycetaceae bacterium]|nr:hypothetical protein [Planctomycetaceae bacterium]